MQETLRRSTSLKSAHFVTERWTQLATFKQASIVAMMDILLFIACNEYYAQYRLSLFPPPGFMTYVAEPLFAEWARFSDTRLSQTMLGHMGLNKASWGSLQQEQTPVTEEAEPSAAGTDTEDVATGGTSSKEIPQGSFKSWHSLCALSPQPPAPWSLPQGFTTLKEGWGTRRSAALLLPHLVLTPLCLVALASHLDKPLILFKLFNF